MSNNIKCPNCGETFSADEAMSAGIEKRLREEYQEKTQQSLSRLEHDRKKLEVMQLEFDEKKKKENELFVQRISQEKQKLETELQEQLRKTISADFENRLRLLQQSDADKDLKLQEARKKEFDFLQKEQVLKNKEAELELTVEKKLHAERTLLSDQIRKQETERSQLRETELQLKLKEQQLQLEENKKLVDELKRRNEQGSMQRQGEAQELLLESVLREQFPFDLIEEIGKGSEGADCIQIVRNATGKECGKIIYESKRTKGWSNNWVEKLKANMRSRGAEIAILVTQVFPKDMERFGERDGVWLCSVSELKSVAALLRSGIINVYEVQRQEENKGDKMQMLYDYLRGNEFKGQMNCIVEGFLSIKQSIAKERIQMEKLWKEREKQLEKALSGASGMYGSIKGIAGASIGDIPLLDGTEEDTLIEN